MEISLSKVKSQEALVSDVPPNPDVKNLLLQFLEHVGDNLAPGSLLQENVITKEVVFEVRVGGICYTLTRSYPQLAELHVSLSPREQEIARLIAKGLPNKTIAAVLDISPWTVSTHLRCVFTKLGVSSRAEMVACVLKDGLLASNR